MISIPLIRDSVCAKCVDGCAECMYSRDHCTVCEPGFVFHQFKCMRECPTDFKVEGLSCVPVKKKCKFGYVLNEESDECELIAAKCEPGYVLNEEMDKCIVEPGFQLPGVFLFIALCWAYIILRQ